MTTESCSSTSDNGGVKPYRKLPAWLSKSERTTLQALAVNATWQQGRQGTGYEKADLMHETATSWMVRHALGVLGNPDGYDAWLLHYPVGSKIPPHTDAAENGMHHIRLNALVVAGVGGVLYLEGKKLPLDEGDAYVFRPDITCHSVTAVRETPRFVFSVGANVEYQQAQELGLV